MQKAKLNPGMVFRCKCNSCSIDNLYRLIKKEGDDHWIAELVSGGTDLDLIFSEDYIDVDEFLTAVYCAKSVYKKHRKGV